MHYYLKSIVRYSREPDKFIKTARNMLRSSMVDTYVVSWPKTGRTWLRVLLGRVFAHVTEELESKILDTYALTRHTDFDTVMFSHGGPFHLFDPAHYQDLQFNHKRFADKKVIFLTRDIRDTLVSSYFQERKRTGVFKGDIQDFVRDPQLGARKIVRFYTMWYENQKHIRDFTSITYEALKADPSLELGRLLKFLGLYGVGSEVIEEAVTYADFGNMRQLEASGTFQDSMMRPGQKNDLDSLKVRRGKVGGFVDYLDADTQGYICRLVKEMGNDECDWYLMDQKIGKLSI